MICRTIIFFFMKEEEKNRKKICSMSSELEFIHVEKKRKRKKVNKHLILYAISKNK